MKAGKQGKFFDAAGFTNQIDALNELAVPFGTKKAFAIPGIPICFFQFVRPELNIQCSIPVNMASP